MTTYHQVLNQLEILKLNHIRNLLPDYLENHTSVSLLEGFSDLLTEEITSRERSVLSQQMKKAHLP